MARIDQLIEQMVKHNVNSVLLIDDQPMRLFGHMTESDGPVVSKQSLDNMIHEITPASLQRHLSYDNSFTFPYQSLSGELRVKVEVSASNLRVWVTRGARTDDLVDILGHTPQVPASRSNVTKPADTSGALPGALCMGGGVGVLLVWWALLQAGWSANSLVALGTVLICIGVQMLFHKD
ncbi:MAG TPA: hypothetical protein VF600_12575 [Abditibacteriaceae bacterium]|jgi:hypothetical protein